MVPEGGIIIKGVYLSKEKMEKSEPGLTIIYKKNSRARDGRGYSIKHLGKVTIVDDRICINCHVAANEKHIYFDKNKEDIFRDYLFIPLINYR